MKTFKLKTVSKTFVYVFFMASTLIVNAQKSGYDNDNFKIKTTQVTNYSDYGVTVWEIEVAGTAGKTTPKPVGKMDGAHVLGYVFPTNLQPTDVGFNKTDGIVALALTSHPDFDDTPLWDENNDAIFNNDGVIWHPHWVVLIEDTRVAGGLAVKQFKKADKTVILPPTNPGMPMYMDSPGYPVTTKNGTIKVVVPSYRMNNQIDFKYDGVACFMKVNASIEGKPLLGVYEVFSVSSGDLSLPYTVRKN